MESLERELKESKGRKKNMEGNGQCEGYDRDDNFTWF